MEGVPTEISLVEGADNIPSDGLTFAVGEDDTGYAYIIHLPVDSMRVHEEIVTNSLEVSHEHIESKFTPDGVFTEKASNSVIMLPVSTTISNTPVATSIAPLTTTTITANLTIPSSTREPTLIPDNSSSGPESSRPIEIEYLEDGVFLHEGEKCDVENLILDSQEVPSTDIKFDPLLDSSETTSVTVYSTLPITTDQENLFQNSGQLQDNFLSEEEPLSNTQPQCSETPARKPEVITNNQVTSSSHPVPKPSVRTYGKPKADKSPQICTNVANDPLKEEIPIVPPANTPLTVPPPPSHESRRVTKIVRIAEVHVKQPQRIAIHIPAKKRRLIIDSQKQIPISDFKRQLVNTKDIVHARGELAPGTKKGMKYLELGSVPQFFASPGRPILNLRLSRLFSNHLVVVQGTDTSTSEFAPLNPDLKFPVEASDKTNDFTKNGKLISKPLKRLMKPLDGYFKGLRKPPVLKQYTRIQRKPTSAPIETKKTSLNSQPPSLETQTIKIEEAVYTVEDGESVVLKSHGIVLAQSNSIQSTPTAEEDTKDEIDSMISGDLTDLEPKIEEEDGFTMSSVPQEFLSSGSSSVDSMRKSVDLQNEEDLKLWGYQVSSS